MCQSGRSDRVRFRISRSIGRGRCCIEEGAACRVQAEGGRPQRNGGQDLFSALSWIRDYGVGGFVLVLVGCAVAGLAIGLAIRHSRAAE